MRAAVRHRIIIFMMCAVCLVAGAAFSEISVKIKDLGSIDGLKENQVYGYGLVVGLQGTGDTKSPLTQATLKNLLKNLGMENDEIESRNTAAVLVTAQLPPFVRIGDRVDITVSSLGDAKSLEGGILVQSPLRGADNLAYVAAQGPLSVPGNGNGRRSVKTVAVISNGGVVERGIKPEIVVNDSIFLVLRHWDYSMADRIIKAITEKYSGIEPVMTDNGKIRVPIKKDMGLPEFIASIESIEIAPSLKARVVVCERDGTIVTGGEVRISGSMVSRKGMTIEIENSGKKVSASMIEESATVKGLVDALNSIGATTGDIIAILKALKAAGALHAELIVR